LSHSLTLPPCFWIIEDPTRFWVHVVRLRWMTEELSERMPLLEAGLAEGGQEKTNYVGDSLQCPLARVSVSSFPVAASSARSIGSDKRFVAAACCRWLLGPATALGLMVIVVALHSLHAARGDMEVGVAAYSPSAPFVEVTASGAGVGAQAPAVIVSSVLADVGGSGYDGYLAVVDNAAPHFHVVGECSKVQRTSSSASHDNCQYAVNGGPFNSYLFGGCIGPMISRGNVLSEDWNTSYASFGLTSSNRWIIGHLTQEVSKSKGVQELVTGFGWLVRDGKVVVPLEASKVAQRTAAGVDGRGRLVFFQNDGCEWCPLSSGERGLTLAQLANLLIKQGVVHAINLDGGGSSATAVNGSVVNRPDCLEVGLHCQRPVTSVLCVT